MNYAHIIQKILHYIDDHLDKDLNIDLLAEIANFSSYHFCRVFMWHTGYPVMKYVRMRRLEYVVSEFSTGKKITDIAINYGFETYSGFSKAFKRYYGVAPEKYRVHVQPTQPLLPNLMHMNSYSIRGLVMNPKLVTFDGIKLVGYELKTSSIGGINYKEIPAFWQACSTDGRMKKLHEADFTENHAEYGACSSVDPESGEFSYFIGLEVKKDIAIPKEFFTWTLPPATHAIFSTPSVKSADFSKTIKGVWQFIMSDWFPKSGYEYLPNGIDFEYYDCEKMGIDGNVCDIYVPVVEIKKFDKERTSK